MKDYSLLKNIESILRPNGLTLLIAEHKFDLESTISDKIRNMINICDIGLVLLTKNGFNSGFVREEIGHLDAKGKPIVLVIEKGFEQKYSGFRFGHDYILFDSQDPTKAMDNIKILMLEHWDRLQKQLNEKLRFEQEEQARVNRNALIAIGIFAGILFLSANE